MADEPAPDPVPAYAREPHAEAEALKDAVRAEKISELARLVPHLRQLAADPRASVRATVAMCFSILANAGQAPADREVWRMLLGLAAYDEDENVRAAADRALTDFENYGTVGRPAAKSA